MTQIIKRSSVEYSAAEMFSLVNDINAYPDFLPWCTATEVIEDHGDSLKASISIAVGKIKQTFTTANTMHASNLIMMRLVKGPFKELNGCWTFQDNENDGCLIVLDMQFGFKNRLIQLTLDPAFQKIIGSLVDAFIERARIVYGTKQKNQS